MRSLLSVPIYNQARQLPRVLDELDSTDLPCDEILLVNDGSTDGSDEIARASGHPTIGVSRNVGLGHCMQMAIQWALDRDYDVLGLLAANGKMLPGEMHRLMTPLREGRADFVTGSRFLPGGASPNLPRFRARAILWVNRFVWLATGTRLSDATCGYRAYRLELIRRAEFDWRAPWLRGYAFEYYLYAKVLLDRGIPWVEVPITMRYPAPGREYSKISPGIGWYEMLAPWAVARIDGKGFAEAPRSSPTP